MSSKLFWKQSNKTYAIVYESILRKTDERGRKGEFSAKDILLFAAIFQQVKLLKKCLDV